jgi:hypothetical protein
VPVTEVPGRTLGADSARTGAATVVGLLLTLSAPRQFVANTGVTEQTHCPTGTLLSVHRVEVTVPVQPDTMVCAARVAASYFETT